MCREKILKGYRKTRVGWREGRVWTHRQREISSGDSLLQGAAKGLGAEEEVRRRQSIWVCKESWTVGIMVRLKTVNAEAEEMAQ